ncbi:MAG: NTP/NDP exchange transporter [Alphaproteobacteria bacterium]|nr:NTP/NDP exchange transporter [Alphaproteobacteria bacterium]MBT5540658.1 NTP/NDP exchange transporter [Alphaproteobacteria bacterium]
MDSQINQSPAFGKLRNFLMPIHNHEFKKFLPLTLMMFCVLFNYTLLRNAKDTLVITASGPETIPFLKGVVILPVSILFLTLYSKLSNLFERSTIFYLGIGFFIGFFAIFALFLYPYREFLEPAPEYIAHLKKTYPYIQHIFPVIGNWTFSLFYLFAELWGAIALGLLFWQFSNEIVKTSEAKRFYTMFGFLSHFALIAAGLLGNYLCAHERSISGHESQDCSQYLNLMILSVTLSGFLIMYLQYWLRTRVVGRKRSTHGLETPSGEAKTKLSLWESLKHILRSKYLGLIAILVLGYGMSNNILGLLWKRELQLMYPTPLEYGEFMGIFSIITGVATILLTFFSKGIISRFGWFAGAIITPLVLLVMGALFFNFILFESWYSTIMASVSLTPLMLAIWLGTSQQVLSKGSKYSLFDPTKEMAYIPLDLELRSKGKAAVDVVAHSFSKASGGYVIGGLLMVTAAADILTMAPYLVGVVFITVSVWLYAVVTLSKLYKSRVKAPAPKAAKAKPPASDDEKIAAGASPEAVAS